MMPGIYASNYDLVRSRFDFCFLLLRVASVPPDRPLACVLVTDGSHDVCVRTSVGDFGGVRIECCRCFRFLCRIR